MIPNSITGNLLVYTFKVMIEACCILNIALDEFFSCTKTIQWGYPFSKFRIRREKNHHEWLWKVYQELWLWKYCSEVMCWLVACKNHKEFNNAWGFATENKRVWITRLKIKKSRVVPRGTSGIYYFYLQRRQTRSSLMYLY